MSCRKQWEMNFSFCLQNIILLFLHLQSYICAINGDFHSPYKEFSTQNEIFEKRCTFDKICDNEYGYICREGYCKCRWGKPDPLDGYKCKVQVKLGDYCRELSRSEYNYRREVYVRRKCPHYAECNSDTGICECRRDFFFRQGSRCLPKVLNTSNPCYDHKDCLIQRGQQCFKGVCVECAVGQFAGFVSSSFSYDRYNFQPRCTCSDKAKWKMGFSTNLNLTFNSHRLRPHPSLYADHLGHCILHSSYGDHCTVTKNCVRHKVSQLQCLKGTCQCKTGTKMLRSPGMISHGQVDVADIQFCYSPVDSPCLTDIHCHPDTAFCETRNAVPACKCREGYQAVGEFCVSRFYGERCGPFFGRNLQDLLRAQRLACVRGEYRCFRPREMFWSGDKGKCVSLVGGRCDLGLDDCAGSSRCWVYKGLKEFRCQCLSSEYKPTRDRRNCEKIQRLS